MISVAGTWLQIVAEGWLVYQLTHSPAWLGIVAGAGALPGLLLGLWGGQVADRYPRRRILMLCQAGFMVLALMLALLVSGWWIPIRPWHVVVLAAIGSAVGAFSGPAFQSFIPEMVPREALTARSRSTRCSGTAPASWARWQRRRSSPGPGWRSASC